MATATAPPGHLPHSERWVVWFSMTDIKPNHFRVVLFKKKEEAEEEEEEEKKTQPNTKPNPRTLGSGSLGAA
jgi:hypothetical protein